MSNETLLERVRRVAWGNHGPKLTEADARAILREVADAVEDEAIVRWEDYGAPDERDAEWHSVAEWIHEQAAEEGAENAG